MNEIRNSSLLGKITVFVIICCCCLPAQAKYGGGSGTSNEPYLIYDANHMNAIGADANDWNKHFKLMSNIDLSTFTGTSFNIIGSHISYRNNKPFTGVFDGNGHKISNYTFSSTGKSSIGIFSYMDGKNAKIKNLGLIEPDVDAGAGNYVGSLVGRLTKGTITGCYVKGGGVKNSYGSLTGGLVGWNSYGTITNCYATTSVSGLSYAGGLVGSNGGIITNCYSTAGVSGNSYYTGGLVGSNGIRGKITRCYSTGSASGNYVVGGLVGFNVGKIKNCRSTGVVEGTMDVGGLVGENRDTIDNSHSAAEISGKTNVGGVVGFNRGTIANCYSTASFSGTINVGGLVGQNGRCYTSGCHPGTVSTCYSTGNVSGDDNVGGLVGQNFYGKITSCYSTGDVSADSAVGGLVGKNGEKGQQGIISNCYATGTVTGNNNVGGLVGGNDSTVNASFWDIENSGQSTGTGGTGLPTAQMRQKITFTDAGWDFNTPVWTIDEGLDYPRLSWELTPLLRAEPEVTLGAGNTISWDPVPGANDYYAECAADADFTKIIHNSGWITKTSCEFTALVPGRTYWYRVKARNANGLEGRWSDVEASLQGTLDDAVEKGLEPESLKNENM